MESKKQLVGKAYGSIPHMTGSKMDKSDKRISIGMENMLTVKTKTSFDTVIVQEKLDGSCCAVANIEGKIIPVTRSGYHALSSPYVQHHMFNAWVMSQEDRFKKALPISGYRIVGEWMVQAHGTIYDMPHEPYVVFDIMDDYGNRLPYLTMLKICHNVSLITPHLISYGNAISINDAMKRARWTTHGGIPVEGVVYRYEADEVVTFLAKYVRPDKEDGRFLPEISGDEPIWNSFVGSRHTNKMMEVLKAYQNKEPLLIHD